MMQVLHQFIKRNNRKQNLRYPILKKDKDTVLFMNLQKFYIESGSKK